jgi:hypothetical protein
VTDIAAWIEATGPAQFLKASRWVYPFINAGHVLGIALLVGAVIPMSVRMAGFGRVPPLDQTLRLLRPFAVLGLLLAASCGLCLFITQASDYVRNGWFQAKMALIALATAHALVHSAPSRDLTVPRPGVAAISAGLWLSVLICGRMIGYS